MAARCWETASCSDRSCWRAWFRSLTTPAERVKMIREREKERKEGRERGGGRKAMSDAMRYEGRNERRTRGHVQNGCIVVLDGEEESAVERGRKRVSSKLTRLERHGEERLALPLDRPVRVERDPVCPSTKGRTSQLDWAEILFSLESKEKTQQNERLTAPAPFPTWPPWW